MATMKSVFPRNTCRDTWSNAVTTDTVTVSARAAYYNPPDASEVSSYVSLAARATTLSG